MARKTTKAIKRRLVITVPVTLTLIVFATVTSVLELNKIKNYKEEEKKLTTELEELKENAESLNIEITKLSSPDYIARYAREKYLYTKDGEKVVIVDVAAKEEKIEENNKTIDKLTYIAIGTGSFLFLTIIIVIIIKSRKSKNIKNS